MSKNLCGTFEKEKEKEYSAGIPHEIDLHTTIRIFFTRHSINHL